MAARAVAHHPAVIRLIARVVTAGARAGIPVDVCGEAAGDPEMLPLLVGLGVDELSVSPARLAATRRMIRVALARSARAQRPPRRCSATTADEVARDLAAPRSTTGVRRASASRPAIASSASDAPRRWPRPRSACRRWRPARAPAGCSSRRPRGRSRAASTRRVLRGRGAHQRAGRPGVQVDAVREPDGPADVPSELADIPRLLGGAARRLEVVLRSTPRPPRRSRPRRAGRPRV